MDERHAIVHEKIPYTQAAIRAGVLLSEEEPAAGRVEKTHTVYIPSIQREGDSYAEGGNGIIFKLGERQFGILNHFAKTGLLPGSQPKAGFLQKLMRRMASS